MFAKKTCQAIRNVNKRNSKSNETLFTYSIEPLNITLVKRKYDLTCLAISYQRPSTNKKTDVIQM